MRKINPKPNHPCVFHAVHGLVFLCRQGRQVKQAEGRRSVGIGNKFPSKKET